MSRLPDLPERLGRVFSRAMDGKSATDADLRAVIGPETLSGAEADGHLRDVAALSETLKRARAGKGFEFCAIVNAKSGKCSENCAFCAQSSHNRADSPVHAFLDPREIAEAAQRGREAGATRFGIVTSGLRLTQKDFATLALAVTGVREKGMAADVSVGVLDADRIQELKRAGLSGVHHNLETGRAFFPNICTTHDYDQDVDAVRTAVASGLHVCSGGIFGVGESWDDRIELALTLRELQVPSVPLNFLHPVRGTRCEHLDSPTALDAVRVTALFRLLLPEASLRICGGRQDVFPGQQADTAFSCGADGVMIGDFLTIAGGEVSADMEAAQRAGLDWKHF